MHNPPKWTHGAEKTRCERSVHSGLCCYWMEALVALPPLHADGCCWDSCRFLERQEFLQHSSASNGGSLLQLRLQEQQRLAQKANGRMPPDGSPPVMIKPSLTVDDLKQPETKGQRAATRFIPGEERRWAPSQRHHLQTAQPLQSRRHLSWDANKEFWIREAWYIPWLKLLWETLMRRQTTRRQTTRRQTTRRQNMHRQTVLYVR
jgi:hypothetical protein